MAQLNGLFKTLIIGTAVSLLLGGCSGHALQDWADEALNEKGSDHPQEIEAHKPMTSPDDRIDDTAIKAEGHTTESSREVTRRNISDDKTDTTYTEPASPSENPALQSVSPALTASNKNAEHRILQQKTNAWIEEEWTPKVETNTTIKAQNEEKERPFTLQEYVDKAGVYLREKENEEAGKPKEPSHKEQMDALPVIGK